MLYVLFVNILVPRVCIQPRDIKMFHMRIFSSSIEYYPTDITVDLSNILHFSSDTPLTFNPQIHHLKKQVILPLSQNKRSLDQIRRLPNHLLFTVGKISIDY